MKQLGLYSVVKKAVDNGLTLKQTVDIAKAATDYTVGGTLQRTKALNLWDGLKAKSNLFARIRRVVTSSTSMDLSKYINQGVLTGKSGAATAMDAVRGGTEISGIVKKNIGNTVTQKELYFLFNLVMEELAEYAQFGANVFERETLNQINTDWSNKLENQLLNGDNSVNEANGILPYMKANLATSSAEELSGIKIRNIDTTAEGITTQTGALDALISKQLPEFLIGSVILMSYQDFLIFLTERGDSSNFSGTKSNQEAIDILRRYKGIEIIPLPYMPQGNYVITPLNNIAWCVNMGNVKSGIINQEVPESTVKYVKGFWNFGIVTFNEAVIAYAQT